MNRYILPLLAAFCVLLAACSQPKPVNKFADEELIKIHEYGYQLSTAQLLPYLKHANSNYRKEACLALASVQDTASWKPLMDVLYNDEDEAVQVTAAYAIGQFKVITSIRLLNNAYQQSKSFAVRAAILESMGKLVQQDEVKWVFDLLAEFHEPNEVVLEGYGRCILWLHNRGFYNDNVMKRIPFMLQYSQGNSRSVLSAAMARYRGDWFKDNTKYLISWLKTERTPDVKANILAMIGGAADPDLHKTLVDYAQSSSMQVNVRFAAIKALRRSQSLKTEDLLPLLSNKNVAIALAAAQALNDAVDIQQQQALLENESTQNDPMVQAYVQCTQARLANADAKWLEAKVANAATAYVAAAYVDGAALLPATTEGLVNIALNDVRPVVRTTAANSLATLLQANKWPATVPVFANLQKLVKTQETGIVSSLLPAIENAALGDSERAEMEQLLLEVQQKLSMPADIETYNMISEVLQHWGKSATLQTNTAPYTIDWKKVTSILPDQKVTVHTAKGDIVFQLHVESAPAAVAYFLDQVKAGFYNGKYFHRVIPAFVAQGGCPRGDGMGSTTPLLRSELYEHTYSPGTVGLASSGKDTESCQWFISLAPTYHLEGRYTIFAHVESGLEVAQSLVVGDIIQSIDVQ